MNKKKIYIVETLKVATIAIVIFYGLINYNFKKTIDSTLEEDISNRYMISRVIFDGLQERVGELERDINFLSNTTSIKEYISGYKDQEFLETLLINLMNSKRRYSQIRILDNLGNERLRLDNREGKIITSSYNQLQNKGKRYYFKEMQSLPIGKTYFSKIDLNFENGMIEKPFNPTVRVGRVVESNAGERYYLIVNYKVDWLARDTSFGEDSLMVVDQSSYWLKNEYDTLSQWGGFIANRNTRKLSVEYPDVWHSIQKNRKGRIDTKEGVFIYEPISIGRSREYYGIHFFPSSYRESLVLEEQDFYTKSLARGIFISIIISIIIGYFKGENKIYGLKLHREATRDSMTGVFNRRYSLRCLEEFIDDCHLGTLEGLAIAYIDVNGLKQVNDTYGHVEGDALIKSVCDALTSVTRGSDIIGRLGGDEFLLLFPNTNKEQAIKAIKRAQGSIVNKKLYKISFAYGVEEISSELPSSELLLNSVDESMYAMKQRQKGISPSPLVKTNKKENLKPQLSY